MTQPHSAELNELAAALTKAQALIEGAKEDSSNPFFKSKYADLSSVWAACKTPLSTNGLSIVQTVETENDKPFLVTMLLHTSGQWVKSFMPIIVTKNDPQSFGSAVTYCRRYALAAIVGVCPADDDAEEAMKGVRNPAPRPIRMPPKAPETISPDKIVGQQEQIEALLNQDKEAYEKLLNHLSIKELDEINPVDYERVIEWLNKRKEKKKDESTRVA